MFEKGRVIIKKDKRGGSFISYPPWSGGAGGGGLGNKRSRAGMAPTRQRSPHPLPTPHHCQQLAVGGGEAKGGGIAPPRAARGGGLHAPRAGRLLRWGYSFFYQR
nr:hypothetical protein [Morchella crassipes]